MDLRRERKRSLKVREQQEAEIERIEASKEVCVIIIMLLKASFNKMLVS